MAPTGGCGSDRLYLDRSPTTPGTGSSFSKNAQASGRSRYLWIALMAEESRHDEFIQLLLELQPQSYATSEASSFSGQMPFLRSSHPFLRRKGWRTRLPIRNLFAYHFARQRPGLPRPRSSPFWRLLVCKHRTSQQILTRSRDGILLPSPTSQR